uniref:Immunoglobulin superfamily, member 5a n=1 Tax=Scophthalmus maximus TaxID=52904 RepID=A0A8D3CMA0_SCOMX
MRSPPKTSENFRPTLSPSEAAKGRCQQQRSSNTSTEGFLLSLSRYRHQPLIILLQLLTLTNVYSYFLEPFLNIGAVDFLRTAVSLFILQDNNTSMTVSWKPWTALFYILFKCSTGVSQQFQLEPLNSTVLQGSDVRFNATVEGDWRVMTWDVGDFQVLTFTVNGTILRSSPRFSAGFCSAGDKTCVEFIIHSVTRKETGPVECTVQGEYGSKTAQLNVQEGGTVHITGGDVTVVQDQLVEFQCVSAAWFPTPTVTWMQNDQAVDSSLYNTSSMADADFFNATSVLKLQAVRNATVECRATVPALTNPQSSSVFMVVVSQQFQLEPLNSTVLQGSDVRFNATVEGDWRVMTWGRPETFRFSLSL